MIRISFDLKRDPVKDEVFLLRRFIVFLFLMSMISGVTANPVSPREDMQYMVTAQVYSLTSSPVTCNGMDAGNGTSPGSPQDLVRQRLSLTTNSG